MTLLHRNKRRSRLLFCIQSGCALCRCWLKELSFYGAFVAPVCLILIINFLAFALVLRQILGMSERKLNKSDSFTVTQQLRGATGVAILLGLTWIFAVFAIDQASVVFYYLFAIFNSLQVGFRSVSSSSASVSIFLSLSVSICLSVSVSLSLPVDWA